MHDPLNVKIDFICYFELGTTNSMQCCRTVPSADVLPQYYTHSCTVRTCN